MLLDTLILIIVLLFSMVFHEVAHGYAAYKLGDPTAKYAGRLTLNPLAHLDPVGSFLFPLFTLIITLGRGPVFGWAKPVPINPYNFSDQKWGELKVSAAGPGINFLIALFFGSLVRFFSLPLTILDIFSFICIYNLFLMLFNLLPIPPLDGSHILFSLLGDKYYELKIMLQQYGLLFLFLFLYFGLDFIEPLVFKMYSVITGQGFAF